MKYFIYILQSQKDKSYYIGTTKNIQNRFNQHNKGYSKATRSKKPFNLIYKEVFNDIKSAHKREKYLKSLKSRKYLEKIIYTS